MKTAKRNKTLMDFAPALRAILSGTAVLAGVIIATATANAAPITILNGNFEDIPVPNWYEVMNWDEGGGATSRPTLPTTGGQVLAESCISTAAAWFLRT